MRHGIYALLDLCVAKAGLTLNDIRRLHASRFSLINLVSDMFDKCAGLQSNAVPKDERMSDLERSLFHIIIYGELFASTMAAFLHPQLALPRFDHEFRMDYIKYCIPDPMCRSYKSMTVLKVGPYAEDGIHLMPQAYDQDDLAELFLRCPACRQVWERVRLTIGPDFTDEWRQQMWCSALRTQGWKGLEMQLPERVEIWRPKLQAIQNSIATLPTESKPEKYIYQREHCWESPNMAAEISVTLQGSELY
ncbi:MAG: hypothetical protein L6R39_004547 [Caloplaca ligustica]|nr:MAG: hypothetical protein L6R39_004547 [Caloplaca ligustica]